MDADLPSRTSIPVPYIVGLPVRQARQVIGRAELFAAHHNMDAVFLGGGEVVYQEPAAGTLVPRMAVVKYWIEHEPLPDPQA
jgi:hypothetical protein